MRTLQIIDDGAVDQCMSKLSVYPRKFEAGVEACDKLQVLDFFSTLLTAYPS